MFENIDPIKKREILLAAKPIHETALYESLVRLGLDPESFDIETFEGTEENYGLANLEFCNNASSAIQNIKMIDRELAKLGE